MTRVSTSTPAASSAELRTSDLPRYITISDAAQALDSKPWPIMRLVRAGELAAVEYDGTWLVSALDVEKLDGVVPQGRAVQYAGDEVLRALEVPLSVINEARGTDHTLASVAAACWIDVDEVDELTLADTDTIAAHIGRTLLTA